MIVKQTTTLIFEYPQDYLQEQEWCKTKADRWVHKGTDTLCSVYESETSYSVGASVSIKTEPQTAECPFDDSIPCEWVCTEYGKCKYKQKTEPQTDGYMTAEQTEDYRKMLDKAEHKVYGNIEDEPQTEVRYSDSTDYQGAVDYVTDTDCSLK